MYAYVNYYKIKKFMLVCSQRMIIPNVCVSRYDLLNHFGISFLCQIRIIVYFFTELPLILGHQSMFEIFYIIYKKKFNHIILVVRIMDLVGAIQRLSIYQLYRVNLSYVCILKPRTYELSYSFV